MQVRVFASTGRLKSFEEMRDYVLERYTEDGNGIDSAFMTETALEH